VGLGGLSAIVDNIPYVATMSPVVAGLADQAGPGGGVLWWALALGADLGGNATAVGASANVVALGVAEREGHRISFWEFSRYGRIWLPNGTGLLPRFRSEPWPGLAPNSLPSSACTPARPGPPCARPSSRPAYGGSR
jgi:hypothetical protein